MISLALATVASVSKERRASISVDTRPGMIFRISWEKKKEEKKMRRRKEKKEGKEKDYLMHWKIPSSTDNKSLTMPKFTANLSRAKLVCSSSVLPLVLP